MGIDVFPFKTVQVKSWEEASLSLVRENNSILNILDSIAKQLKKSNRDYVYVADFEYGENVITKGHARITEISDDKVSKNGYNSNISIDLGYSKDPLALVSKNYFEVHGKNRSRHLTRLNNKAFEYDVPLNIIKEGDFMGVFGTLDYVFSDSKSDIEAEWYVTAGRVSFCVTLPELGKTLLRTVNNPEWFDEYYNPSNENNKIPPLEKHRILINNIIRHFDKKWHGSLIYFPAHFLQKSCHDTDVFLNKIKEIGWEQVSPIKNYLFENKAIWDMLISHDDHDYDDYFFTFFYDYLIQASKGNSYLLRLNVDKNDILNECLQEIIENGYFKSNKGCAPLIFTYEKLEKDGDWGICPVHFPPVINFFHPMKLDEIRWKLNMISSKLKNNPNRLTGYEAYQTDIKSGSDFKENEVRYNGVFKRHYLSDYIKSKVSNSEGCIEEKEILSLVNLEHPFFQNFILLKKKSLE